VDPHDPQWLASDPAASAWVSASAGTGKTKVLTDRVIGLLFKGVAPHRILCVTFTKAAAAEMRQRITDQLAHWATCGDDSLQLSLQALLQRTASEEELARARQLLFVILHAPTGVRIQTLHAFCQSLLSQFPLEAQVAPHFSVADERSSNELIAESTKQLLLLSQSDSKVSSAIETLTSIIPEHSFPRFVLSVVRQSARFRACTADGTGIGSTVARVYERLGLRHDDTEAALIAAACSDAAFDKDALAHAADVLRQGGKTDAKRALAVENWLSLSDTQRLHAFTGYAGNFLTEDDDSKLPTLRSPQALCSKPIQRSDPNLLRIMLNEGLRLLSTTLSLRAARTASATSSLLVLADAAIEVYQRLKVEGACLDFDDLIMTAAEMLERDGGALWVRYKLDGGIDHVLVDEAQDTSRDQWRVIRALTSEFFHGANSSDRYRTFFGVGDAKQSIYSFQGADPSYFIDSRDYFCSQARVASAPMRSVELRVSYRSNSAVLAAVDAVFAREEAARGVSLDDGKIRHQVSARRLGDGGLVEVWPPIVGRSESLPPPWQPPVQRVEKDAPGARLAGLLARRIAQMIQAPEQLPSRGRPIMPGDIMILVRRRDAFIEEFVRVCKALSVPVAGIDRLALCEHLAVMDLMAIGRFVVNPDDDLTLATVLKGPLCRLEEEAIYGIAWGRADSLWQRLATMAATNPSYTDSFLYLTELQGLSAELSPYEFYARVLGPLGGRRQLLACLGHEADEPVAEFMELALAHQRSHPPSLQGFLHWLESGDVIVKRDLEHASKNAVRIITVHGAKGLQAPIVILPDTMQKPTGHGPDPLPSVYWDESDADGVAIPLWVAATGDLVPRTAACRKAAAADRDAEYRRLLYVALTRAEDRLLICGWHRKRAAGDCWYQMIRGGLLQAAPETGVEQVPDPFLQEASERGDFDGEPVVLRIHHPQTRSPPPSVDQDMRPEHDPPPWLHGEPPPEEMPWLRPLAPSKAGHAPLAAGIARTAGPSAGSSLLKGRYMHRLLQGLVRVQPSSRQSVAQNWLAATAPLLSRPERQELADKAAAVLQHPLFAEASLSDCHAEVDLQGEVNGRLVRGRVDRLMVHLDHVMVIDFKTDQSVPDSSSSVPSRYLLQMALYRALLVPLFPGRSIQCSLFWTEIPSLMELDNRLLDQFLP
jgi:ATP-dependent helicase/nuclease subunit A